MQHMLIRPPANIPIENTNINTRPGVELSPEQKPLVGSVLNLFAGRPSLKKLSLWTDDGVFEDLLNHRQRPEAHDLQTAFSEIERLSHSAKSAGNPISLDLRTRYVVKGLKKEHAISSVVNIYTNSAGRIEKVEDKWDGNLPDSSITNCRKVVGVPKDKTEEAEKGN
ncbi:hypothetical protein V2W45_1471314 [Cenococcum geophilum]